MNKYEKMTKAELISVIQRKEKTIQKLNAENDRLNNYCMEWIDAGQNLWEQTGEMVNLANKRKARQDKFSKELLAVSLEIYNSTCSRPQPLEVLERMKDKGDIVQEIEFDNGQYWIKGAEKSRSIKSVSDRITTIIKNNPDKFPKIKIRKR